MSVISLIGKTAWSCQVWLTAAAMLLSMVPRIECRCPNGELKLFCTAGTCCAAQPAPAEIDQPVAAPVEDAEPACCPHCCAHSKASIPTQEHRQIQPIGCQKSVTQAELAVAASTCTADVDDMVAAFCDTVFDNTSLPIDTTLADISPHCSAPPSKLFTLFQRLVI